MSALEIYEPDQRYFAVAPVETYGDYLYEAPVIETRNGHREYDLLCAAMQSEQGKCVVRKDPNAHSDDPTDWLVIRDNGTNLRQDVVLSAKTIKGEDGDTIELELAADVDYHGPYTLRFSVDPMYNPINSELTLTHQKYYGRGVGEVPEYQIDAVYGEPLIEEPKLAEVIPIETARLRRQQQEVGHTAVAN